MSKKYKYRKDDGRYVFVDFDAMMTQDACGFITLDNGEQARRVHSGFGGACRAEKKTGGVIQPSDSMGFTEHQLSDFEKDRVKNGFSGIEFVKDPSYGKFYQVKASSRREWERYAAHRDMVVYNRTTGVALSESDFEKAKEIILRKK